MPNLYVIDDSYLKCSWGINVQGKLVELHPELDWQLKWSQAVNKLDITEDGLTAVIMGMFNDPDAFALVDIEISDFVAHKLVGVLEAVHADVMDASAGLWRNLGGLDQYRLSAALLARCRHSGIPAIVISTNSHPETQEKLTTLCQSAGYAVIGNWPALTDAPREPQVKSVANSIKARWDELRGKDHLYRLWIKRALDERWWDYPPTGNVVFHNFAQHKLSASGMEKTRVFLSDLFGGTRSPPEYDEDLHDMLKTITGSVAVAHNGTRDRGPTLATIAFMAALWNPANVDFAECNWNCTSNLLPECATFQQIRSALAAIAGSGGLLEACVLTKGNPNGSELLEISCSSTCVSLNLKWLGRNDARSDAEAALGAASEPTKGSTRIALWKAQQALEHAGVRVSKIIIENNYLKFLPA